ncbi:MAG: hypothetical protein M0P26_00175 [Bacteroidales bacterium]|nr:hypothetical protein [Bacteroidales bacterium]
MVEGLGTPAFAELAQAMENLGPKQMRIILWAGLLHMAPELTPKDLYPIINEYLEKHTFEDLAAVVVKGLQEASILNTGNSRKPDQGEVGTQ